MQPSEGATAENSFLDGLFIDANTGPIVNTVDSNPNLGIKITPGDWVFAIQDFDGDFDDINGTLDMTENMIGVVFDPFTAPTVKAADEESGYLSIFFVDQEREMFFDFDLFFEIR